MRFALGDQTDGRTDLTGSTVAALESVMLDEGLLQRMQRASLGQAFDRRHLRTVFHDRQREARVDPPAIDQHGAGAALAVVATLFGPRKVEIETQCVEQRRPRRYAQLALYTVDVQRDGHLGRRKGFFQLLAGR
jgi:hypothetical protein